MLACMLMAYKVSLAITGHIDLIDLPSHNCEMNNDEILFEIFWVPFSILKGSLVCLS